MKTALALTSVGLIAMALILSSCSQSTSPESPVEKIVFAMQTDNHFSNIFTMNSDGTDLARLTEVAVTCQFPCWSGDGAKIAFCEYIDNANQIFVMNSDGSNIHQITFIDTTQADSWISYGSPSWSPDGSQIVCARTVFPDSGGGGAPDIYLMNADGSNLHKLYGIDGRTQTNPAWSPDGSKILFESYADVSGLYTINPDGTGLTFIIGGSGDYVEPSWSPDGTQIAYSFKSYGETGWIWQICIASANGSNPVNLSNNEYSERHPVWSSDGEKIVFVTDELGEFNNEIYTMNTDGAERTDISNSSTSEYWPAVYYAR